MGSKVASTITRNFWWKLIQLTQVNFFCFLFNKIFNLMFWSSWIWVFICRSGTLSGKKDGAQSRNIRRTTHATRSTLDWFCRMPSAHKAKAFNKPLKRPSGWASVTWLRTELLESAMATTKIRKTPGICNGAACIGRTQIPVWQLVSLQLQGCSDATLLGDYHSWLEMTWKQFALTMLKIQKRLMRRSRLRTQKTSAT